jgi:FYVE zinc finger
LPLSEHEHTTIPTNTAQKKTRKKVNPSQTKDFFLCMSKKPAFKVPSRPVPLPPAKQSQASEATTTAARADGQAHATGSPMVVPQRAVPLPKRKVAVTADAVESSSVSKTNENNNSSSNNRFTMAPRRSVAMMQIPWDDDSTRSDCTQCNVSFTWYRRRHHCRNCGHLFCARCTTQRSPVLAYRIWRPVRVCDTCFAKLDSDGGEQAKKKIASSSSSSFSSSSSSSPSSPSSSSTSHVSDSLAAVPPTPPEQQVRSPSMPGVASTELATDSASGAQTISVAMAMAESSSDDDVDEDFSDHPRQLVGRFVRCAFEFNAESGAEMSLCVGMPKIKIVGTDDDGTWLHGTWTDDDGATHSGWLPSTHVKLVRK